VTNVTKHSPVAVLSFGISVFIHEKDHFSVTKHSPRAVSITEFVQDENHFSVMFVTRNFQTGEITFQCDKCDKAFTISSHLTPHQRVINVTKHSPISVISLPINALILEKNHLCVINTL
jgi:uncharacterized Zn-finger protein